MKTVKVGPNLGAVVAGKTDVFGGTEITDKTRNALAIFVEQALAADRIEDLNFPAQLRVINKQEQRYAVHLGLVWDWMPIKLRLTVENSESWEIEIDTKSSDA